MNAQFQKRRHKAVQTGDRLLSAIYDDLARGDGSKLELRVEHLCSLFEFVKLVDEAHEATRHVGERKLPCSQEEEPRVPEYIIGSWFLNQCTFHLTSDPRGHERLYLVTGIKLSARRRTLDNMVKVALEAASAVGALANQHDLTKTLIEMDEWGHQLHGLFHSHPGKGASATRPSDTDLRTHERYENGGYPVIGAIFVKGFVRFFANHPFSVSVYGKGVDEIDKHIFAIRNLPH